MILNCFTPNFKLKYEDSENMKADCLSTVVFNLHQIKRRACVSFFLGHPVVHFLNDQSFRKDTSKLTESYD